MIEVKVAQYLKVAEQILQIVLLLENHNISTQSI